MKMKIAELLTAVIEENNDENCNNIRVSLRQSASTGQILGQHSVFKLIFCF